MKKVLILVLSGNFPPYGRMVDTSCETWGSVRVDGVETVYYFGEHKQSQTPQAVYPSMGLLLPIQESLHNIGKKTIAAFEWAVATTGFDYIARVNSSTYVNKKKLIEHIQTLPEENVFSGLVVRKWQNVNHEWCWGPSFILSKDVVRKLVDNKHMLDSGLMEDVAFGDMASKLEIPLTDGKACSIDYLGDGKWRCLCYGSESFDFTDFADTKKADQYFFRCKQDKDRSQDEFVMRQLFKNLN